MDIFPIWKSTFYETEADSVKFRIMKWGTDEICRATAVRLPEDDVLRIGLNKPCQNYLDSKIDVSATGTTLSNAYAEFSLQVWNESNLSWIGVYDFAFVNDWSYSEHEETGSFSEPINGHASQGQLIPYTICSSSETQETICYDEYDFNAYLVVTPTTIFFDETGGTATITIFSNTNWYLTQYSNLVSVSQTSGASGTTTITITCDENLVFREFTDTLRIRADKRGTTAIEYVHITLEAATPYVRITSGDNAQIDTHGGIWTVTYDTNIPNVYYDFSGGQTGYTSGGTLYVEVPPGTLVTAYTVNFYDVPGGTLCATANATKHDYASDYLTLVIVGAGTIKHARSDTNYAFYSLDEGQTWNRFDHVLNVVEGDRVLVRHFSVVSGTGTNGWFEGTAYFNLEGNIMSMERGSDFRTDNTFRRAGSFHGMFQDTNVVSCANLVFTNAIPKARCCSSMFSGCVSLVEPPYILPATVLDTDCYYGMFYRCTSIRKTPILPATTLAPGCYKEMFYLCSSLVEAPELPVTELAFECYNGMFAECVSLETAPELPATELDDYCYWRMFWGCTSLITPPPILPAETLTKACYKDMFRECVSLVTAPELPASRLEEESYMSMFYGCSNLQYIKCGATWRNELNCTNAWTYMVNDSGTFVKASSTEWETGSDGIPSGWTIVNA